MANTRRFEIWIIGAFLFGRLLYPTTGLSQNQIKIHPSWGFEGEEIDFPIQYEINDLPAGSALQFDIIWDPDFIENAVPAKDDLSTDHEVSFNVISNGVIRVLLFSQSNEDVPALGIVKLKSNLIADLDTDTQPFAVFNLLLSDAEGNELSIESLELTFTVPKNLLTELNPEKDKILANWDDIESANSFELWRSSNDSFDDATKLVEQSEITYTDASVDIPKIYYYWVVANYADGQSSPSNISEFSPFPQTPENFSLQSANHPDKVELFWTNGDKIESVDVFRSTSLDFNSSQKIGSIDKALSQFLDSSGWSGLPYNYWLVGTNEFGVSDPTDPLSGISEFADAEIPEDFKLRRQADNTFSLSWATRSGDLYLVLFSQDLANWFVAPEEFQRDGNPIEWAYDDPDSLGYPIFFKVNQVKE